MIYVLNLRNEWHWIGDCSQAGEGERQRISLLFVTLCGLFLFLLKRVWKCMNNTINIKYQKCLTSSLYTSLPPSLSASIPLCFPPSYFIPIYLPFSLPI